MPYREYLEDVAYCKKIHKKYGKSFYVGTLFLEKDKGAATSILYAFFRFPDEYVDTLYKDNKTMALEKLSRWRGLWKRYYEGGEIDADHDELRILRASKWVFLNYKIPFSYSDAFLSAMEQDTWKDTYETYEELEKYMYGSASVVGLMMTYILSSGQRRFSEDDSYRSDVLDKARALGEAFQMTNFLRDVGEDMKDRGRIYLPLEDLKKFGVSEDDIRFKRNSSEFKLLMEFEIERTKKLYSEADQGIHLLQKEARLGIYIARVLYSRILTKIENAHYDVFSKRLHVPLFEKIVVAIKSIIIHL